MKRRKEEGALILAAGVGDAEAALTSASAEAADEIGMAACI